MNPAAGFDNVDLTYSGKLGDGVRLSSLGLGEAEIYSQDEKYIDISKKYGDENFNIDPEQALEVVATAELNALTLIFNDLYQ